MKVYVGPYPSHSKWHNIIGYQPEQKISVKIDSWDTWSMDETLAHIVLPMLEQLKEKTHGYPNGLTEKKWDAILDEMIFAFRSKTIDWQDEFISGEWDVFLTEVTGSDNMEMNYGDKHTYKIDKESMDKVQKRITKGFKLFGQYYENLWD